MDSNNSLIGSSLSELFSGWAVRVVAVLVYAAIILMMVYIDTPDKASLSFVQRLVLGMMVGFVPTGIVTTIFAFLRLLVFGALQEHYGKNASRK